MGRAMNLLERVEPDRADPAERIVAGVLLLAQDLEQVDDAGDVVRVDVAHHHHPQIERILSTQGVEPRLQHVLVDAPRASIDEDQDGRDGGAGAVRKVQQEAVAVIRLEGFERKSHQVLMPA